MEGPGDVRSLKGPRICAVGPATAEKLARYGLKVDVVPREHRAERAVEAMRAHAELKGAKVLFPRSEIAREVLADDLRKAGALVTDVVAYRTLAAEPQREGDPDVYKLLLERQVDAVTFTSASSVRHFVKALGEEQAPDLLSGTVVASIGPVTAEAAQQLGITSTIVPDRVHRARRSSRRWSSTSGSGLTTHGSLADGPRRLRRTAGLRALVRETRLSADQLVYPLFVCEGTGVRRAVSSMPGVFQLSVDEAVREAKAARADGVGAVLLFGLPAAKDAEGSAALGSAGAGAARRARASSPRCPISSSSPTSASASTPSTATAACSTASASSTTRRSSGWCDRRSCTPRPAPTSSPRPT